jgi:hypothetical protein
VKPRLLILTAVVALAGCGGTSGDLIAIEVSGGFQPKTVAITVTDDGRGTCDRGPLKPISGQTLLDAREIQRELAPYANQARVFPSAGADQRQYELRMREGAVTWPEGGQGLPPALGKAVLLERSLEQQLCPPEGG